MPNQHHISKKRGYTFVIVPEEDAADPKNYRFEPWQLLLMVAGFTVFIVATVIVLLLYTPVGTLMPIPNPELENRYGKQLVSLSQRMESMATQLVELRAYNLKLRKALGEKVVATDTGVVVTSPTVKVDEKTLAEAEQFSKSRLRIDEPMLRDVPRSTPSMLVGAAELRVSFPAVLPAEGYVTRGYSPQERHYGLDIAARTGTVVNAAADGHVVFAGWTSDDGNVVILSHSNGFVTFYKHNQSVLRSVGEYVKRGEPIALLGNSGRTSSGPHLHFEIWKDGSPVDPSEFLLNLNF
ncbi:MAG TPA: M23 family metallopeptidase [Bacteroidota bacterium]|nr:M23 family metallopeptidase [Bacteroidota bacterium]